MNKTKAIVFAGLMCALHIIATFVLKYAWLPGIEFVVLFFVPFFSAMYSYKTKFYYSLIYFTATMIICSIISLDSALLYILPSLVVGLIYGFLVKANLGGTSIIYILTVAEFGLFWASAGILNLVTSQDVIETLSELLHITYSNEFLGIGLLLLYSFAQAFLIHIVTKAELKKIGVIVKKDDHPNFAILVLGLASLVAVFLPIENDTYVFFSVVAAVVFGGPLALYGYQCSKKPWILLIIQAGTFLVGTLPMLLVIKETGYKAISAYILLFAAPIAYAVYKLIKEGYVKNDRAN